MKNFHSLLSALVTTVNLAACVTGDNTAPTTADLPPVAFPRTCAEAAQGDAAPSDGEHTLFIDHDQAKPWLAYCVDIASDAPKEYLTLPRGGDRNWSMYRAGGRSAGTDVTTRFDKVRVDPIALAIDTSDQTFAISTGSLVHLGVTTVTSMPLGVGMTCGGGTASANVDLIDTPFLLANAYTKSGTGVTGNADLWSTNNVIEMWVDGDCGTIAPNGAPDPSMNGTGGLLIALTYQK